MPHPRPSRPLRPSSRRALLHSLRRKELLHALLDDGRQHREVARLAGISQHCLSDIVRGATVTPRPETRAALAAILNVDEDEIFPEFAEGDDSESLTA